MPQSVRLTNDQGERLAARNRLFERISQASEAKAKKPGEVFLSKIPSNHKDLSEFDLFRVLTTSPELEHTRESAVKTIEILSGQRESGNVVFQEIDLQPIRSDVVAERKLSEPDPTTMISEQDNRKRFKDRLAGKIDQMLNSVKEAPKPVEIIEKYANGFNKVGVDLQPLEILQPDYSNINPKIIRDDAAERLNFKKALLSRIEESSVKPIHSEETLNELVIPENFRDMKPINLARIIEIENKIPSEMANQIVFDLLRPEVLEPEMVPVQPEEVEVRVTPDFDNMRTIDKRWFLTTEGELSSDLADEYLAHIDGKPVKGNYVFNVTVVEPRKPTFSVDSKPPLTVDIEDLVSGVAIPYNYAEMSDTELHFFLTHDSVFACSNEKATDAVNYLYSRPTRKSVYVVTPDGEKVEPFAVEAPIVEPIIEDEPVGEFSVSLPDFFITLSARDKYTYLTKELKWLPEKANEFIAAL